MSRSYKKTPIVGFTTAASDKRFKSAEHRRERSAVKVAMQQGDEPPSPKGFGNPCLGEKDGKQYIGQASGSLRK